MSSQVTAAIIAAIVSGITLIVTSVAQWLSRRGTRRDLKEQREHLTERGTLTEQRIRTLNERFATAAGQLGSDKPPPVRLAGVYAMAGLADDWEENRQTCVDVLCAYLRIPYEPDPVGLEPDSLMTTAARHLPSPPSPPSLRRRRRTPANIRPCEASERRRLLPGVCQPLAVKFTGDERSPSSPHAGD